MGLVGAIVGSAVIGTVGTVAATSSAAHSAASSAQHAADSNNALQTQIYGQNTANETPFMSRGNAAGAQINALLGLGGSASTPSQDWNSYLTKNPDVQAGFDGLNAQDRSIFPDAQAYAQYHYNTYGQNEGRAAPTAGPSAAQNAFAQFRNSDGYQFRLGEGLNATNTNFALHGAQGSGAALKALNNYAQGQASNEFGNYFSGLQNQQGVGLSAANALAGVGTNYANAVSSNNNNAAGAAGNAAIAQGNAISSGIGNISNAFGQALGTSSIYTPGPGLVASAGNTIAANPGIF